MFAAAAAAALEIRGRQAHLRLPKESFAAPLRSGTELYGLQKKLRRAATFAQRASLNAWIVIGLFQKLSSPRSWSACAAKAGFLPCCAAVTAAACTRFRVWLFGVSSSKERLT